MENDLFSSDSLKRCLAMYFEDIARGADMVFEMLAEIHLIENFVAIKRSFLDSKFALDSFQIDHVLFAVVSFLILFTGTCLVLKLVRPLKKSQQRVLKTDKVELKHFPSTIRNPCESNVTFQNQNYSFQDNLYYYEWIKNQRCAYIYPCVRCQLADRDVTEICFRFQQLSIS